MVAYSFKAQFEQPIVAGTKRQTVRGFRTRHARPGEPVQLYVGMRTRHCRKIIPDPVCIARKSIEIMIDASAPGIITSIILDDQPLTAAEIERFAKADGFAESPRGSARHAMGEFWLAEHGPGEFSGMVIRWEPV